MARLLLMLYNCPDSLFIRNAALEKQPQIGKNTCRCTIYGNLVSYKVIEIEM